jgi:hypothetical protein
MSQATAAFDPTAPAHPPAAAPRAARPAFEWTFVALATAIGTGSFIDAWAHNHIPSTVQSFFTPWHALLYTSLAAMTALLVMTAAWTGARPRDWVRALPDGYGVALVGCLVFGIGGVFDLSWHIAFGFERGIEALISPTHVFIGIGAGLISSGPLAAAWRRPDRRCGWPAVASAAFILASLTFFGQYDHPFTSQWAAAPRGAVPTEIAEQLGILGVILQTALLMGVVLSLVRRFDLPFGALTLVLGYDVTTVTVIHHADPIILIGVLAGAAGDLLLLALRPSPIRTRELRIFAFAFPTLLWALYFAVLIKAGGVWWPVHLVAGSPLLAGVTGVLVSLLVVPPAASREALSTIPRSTSRPKFLRKVEFN